MSLVSRSSSGNARAISRFRSCATRCASATTAVDVNATSSTRDDFAERPHAGAQHADVDPLQRLGLQELGDDAVAIDGLGTGLEARAIGVLRADQLFERRDRFSLDADQPRPAQLRLMRTPAETERDDEEDDRKRAGEE
jgi:hypothetical protein